MGRLIATKLHRVDAQDNVDEWEVTLYEFDGRGLTTKRVDALGNVTTYAEHSGKRVEYTYDGIGNQTAFKYPDGTKVT